MVPKYYRYSDFVHFSSDSVASLHTSILPKVYSHKKKKKAQWDADISIAVKCLNYLEPSLKQKGNKTFIGSDVMANLMDMKDYGVIVDRSIN